ncbi:MAG: hypothetical protein ACYDAG_10160, partial [Chloroflexota bacterium]
VRRPIQAYQRLQAGLAHLNVPVAEAVDLGGGIRLQPLALARAGSRTAGAGQAWRLSTPGGSVLFAGRLAAGDWARLGPIHDAVVESTAAPPAATLGAGPGLWIVPVGAPGGPTGGMASVSLAASGSFTVTYRPGALALLAGDSGVPVGR